MSETPNPRPSDEKDLTPEFFAEVFRKAKEFVEAKKATAKEE